MSESPVVSATVRRIRVPLPKPYKVAYRVHETFEPVIVEVACADGATGFGEANVPPDYSDRETPESAWRFAVERAARLVGGPLDAAMRDLDAAIGDQLMAGSALMSALEMAAGHPALDTPEAVRFPLLTPLSATDPAAIRDEIDRFVAEGYPTVKVKVGWDVDSDLARVAAAQEAGGGRVTFRVDANHSYSVTDGKRFASSIDPAGIELFEQPCATDDWDGNAAVAAVCRVPMMLDESISTPADVDRAATIPNVRFVKMKLKRAGGIGRLLATVDRAGEKGVSVVLGDGVSTELSCWMEACCARLYPARAGEMNGYLKPKVRLFREPLGFENGSLVIPAGFRPQLDRAVLDAHTTERVDYGT
jgi:L-alanine-DL-glutamate epimerase-like enolase superfamily enzyme